jgi:hypothetical protein
MGRRMSKDVECVRYYGGTARKYGIYVSITTTF